MATNLNQRSQKAAEVSPPREAGVPLTDAQFYDKWLSPEAVAHFRNKYKEMEKAI
jgi:hypothetical protein